MSSNSIITSLILIIICSCQEVDISILDKGPYSIVLIAGQSNTLSGKGLDPILDAPMEGIMQLGRLGKSDLRIIEAFEPLQHHGAGKDKIGFGLSFAKLLKAHLDGDSKILIIPCGSGGTGFSNHFWNKGDELYMDAVERTKMVLERNAESKLECILWHQGESDVGSPTYEADLDNFIISLRDDLKAYNVPFILGGMVPFWVEQDNNRIVQQQIIANTVNRHNLVGYADPEIPFRIEKEDNSFNMVHYNAQGQRELGKRYFDEFLELTQ